MFLKSAPASDAMIAGELDAYFITSGYPTNAIIELASRVPVTLVPIDGPEVEAIAEKLPFYSLDTIPAGAYEGVDATTTLAVGAQWITSTAMDEELIYQITKALWNDQSRRFLDVGHTKGKEVSLDTALEGTAILLHAGAEAFYREAGRLE